MMLVLTLAAVLAQQADPLTMRELERIEQELAAAWSAGDCARWGALLAPEWSVTHITGTVMTKAQALDMCRAPRTSSMAQTHDDIVVRGYGDAAIVTGRNTVTITGTEPQTLTLRFTDVFMRTNGRWLVVASHATRVAAQ